MILITSLSVLFQVLTLLPCIATATCSTAADSKPNILIIVGDDMGLSGCRHARMQTFRLRISMLWPGTRFTSGYVSGPRLLTDRAGLPAHRSLSDSPGCANLNPGGNDSGLPTNQSTLVIAGNPPPCDWTSR
ncbi:MAG: hypothetical protein U0892_12325 [Pirellulales bacterium]